MPSRIVDVSREMPASVTQESVGPGQPVAAQRYVVIRPKERRIAQRLCGMGDRELIGVGGTLLGFDEDAEIHGRQRKGVPAGRRL